MNSALGITAPFKIERSVGISYIDLEFRKRSGRKDKFGAS